MKFLITLGVPFLLHVITHKSLSLSLPRLGSNENKEDPIKKLESYWPSTIKFDNYVYTRNPVTGQIEENDYQSPEDDKNDEFNRETPPLHENEENSSDGSLKSHFMKHFWPKIKKLHNFDNERNSLSEPLQENEDHDNVEESDLLPENTHENEEPDFEEHASEELENVDDDNQMEEEENYDNENLDESDDLLSEHSHKNKEPNFEDYASEEPENIDDDNQLEDENYENENLEEYPNLMPELLNENEETSPKDNDAEELENPENHETDEENYENEETFPEDYAEEELENNSENHERDEENDENENLEEYPNLMPEPSHENEETSPEDYAEEELENNSENHERDEENDENENLEEYPNLMPEPSHENKETSSEDYATEELENNSENHETDEENDENENLEEPVNILSEESDEIEEPNFEEDDTEELENYDDINQITVENSHEGSGILGRIANCNLMLAVTQFFDEIVDGAEKELYEKSSESTEKAHEVLGTQSKGNGEKFKRKKRSLFDVGLPSMDFMEGSLSHATKDLVTDLLSKPNQHVSQQSTSNNEIALPELPDKSNPLSNLMAMPELIDDFTAAAKNVFKEFSQSTNEIKEAVHGLIKAHKSDSITEKLLAAGEAQQVIHKELLKAQYAFSVVNETLYQIGIASQSHKGQFTSSQCIQTLADIPVLLSSGRNCLMAKFNEGREIFNKTMVNLATASNVPEDVSNEVRKCNEAENNIMGQLTCYTTIPLMLKEDEILLPIEFVKRVIEASQYFATLREDLIKCGVRTLVAVAEQGEKCAAELILFYRDLALRSASATEAYKAETQSSESPLVNVFSSTLSHVLG